MLRLRSGPADQMSTVWKSADICILVSEFEGTSISMLEAMAQGCIPVVTQVSGTAAVIKSGENGYVTHVGDLESMAQIIQSLDGEREKLRQLGLKAYETILNRFSLQDYVDWFLELSDRVWQQSPRAWLSERPVVSLEQEIVGLKHEITAMKTSRFWQLREKWFALKRFLTALLFSKP